MFDYIRIMLKELPQDMTGPSGTPAGECLFNVSLTNPKLLDSSLAKLFHHYVAKLLFLCKRARPDIHTAVAFLCKRPRMIIKTK